MECDLPHSSIGIVQEIVDRLVKEAVDSSFKITPNPACNGSGLLEERDVSAGPFGVSAAGDEGEASLTSVSVEAHIASGDTYSVSGDDDDESTLATSPANAPEVSPELFGPSVDDEEEPFLNVSDTGDSVSPASGGPNGAQSVHASNTVIETLSLTGAMEEFELINAAEIECLPVERYEGQVAFYRRTEVEALEDQLQKEAEQAASDDEGDEYLPSQYQEY